MTLALVHDRAAIESRGPAIGTLAPRAHVVTDAPSVDLDGTWRLRLAPSVERAADDDWQSPASQVTDGWSEVTVPGHWVLQGHGAPWYTNIPYPFPLDPPHVLDDNPTADYVRDFDATALDVGARGVLRFLGVEGAATIWLNGASVGTIRGSRLTHEFDVTALLRPGRNRLAVRVSQFSAASYLEDQDMWWLPGIFRSVTLLTRPAGAIDDVAVHADYDAETGEGLLRIDVVSAGRVSIRIPELGIETEAGVEVRAPGVEPWTAERPRLYAAIVEAEGETATLRIGFRRVEVRGGQVVVNGRPVLFRGVNRHEHHPERGRVLTLEETHRELQLMKRSNINAIRTAHYPPHPDLLDLADELGFYVVLENDLETHGFELVEWQGNPSDDIRWRDAYVDRIRRTVHRDRNHASVVMWSLGNESHAGANIDAMSETARAIDPTRLIHYEGDRSCRGVDVYSRMYCSLAEVDAFGREPEEPPAPDLSAEELRRRTLPFLLCEYAHAMGSGPGALAEYQELFERHPRLAGGFIWEWIEHGLATRDADGARVIRYGGDFGEVSHDGNFVIDGLVSADRQPRPSLADVAAVFAPVAITIDGGDVIVRSRFDHAETDGLGFTWIVESADGTQRTGVLEVPVLAPGETARVSLPDAARTGDGALRVDAALAADAGWAPSGHVVATGSRMLGGALAEQDAGFVTAADGVLRAGPVELDASTGRLMRLGRLAVSQADVGLWRAPTDNDRAEGWDEIGLPPMADRWEAAGIDRLLHRTISVDVSDSTVRVVRRSAPGGLAHGVDTVWTWTALDADRVGLDVEIVPFGEWTCTWARAGIDLVIDAAPGTVTWFGSGPSLSVPDTGAGNAAGWHTTGPDALVTPHVHPQESGSRRDVRLAAVELGTSTVRLHAGGDVALGVSPFSRRALADTSHHDLLRVDGRAHLSLDVAQSGFGSATCGPGVLPRYRVPAARRRFSVVWEVGVG